MRAWLLGLLLLAGCSLSGESYHPYGSADQHDPGGSFIGRTRSALLRAYGDGFSWAGTAFPIRQDIEGTLYATAKHCVEDSLNRPFQLILTQHTGEGYQSFPATVYKKHTTRDIAILFAPVHTGDILSVAGSPPEFPRRVKYAGFVINRTEIRVCEGEAKGLETYDNKFVKGRIRVVGFVERGLSGSAVCDEGTGLVLGILVRAYLEGKTGYTFWAEPAWELVEMLR